MKISVLAFSSLLLLGACSQHEADNAPAPAPAARPVNAIRPNPMAQSVAIAQKLQTAQAAAVQPAATRQPGVAAQPAGDPPPIAVGTKMKCPVSGDDFTVKEKTQQVVYNGKRYAFCCPDCLPEFNKNPAKFAAK